MKELAEVLAGKLDSFAQFFDFYHYGDVTEEPCPKEQKTATIKNKQKKGRSL